MLVFVHMLAVYLRCSSYHGPCLVRLVRGEGVSIF